jgi:hypothetical protein
MMAKHTQRTKNEQSDFYVSPDCAPNEQSDFYVAPDFPSNEMSPDHGRALDGEQVPNSEKIYSIFEPHTDLIKRGKVRSPVEFGHKVFLAESAQGLITQYEVLKGNPSDEIHVAPSLRRHKQAFGQAPELYGTDRGFFSERNLASCRQVGVKIMCIPQRGDQKTKEREAYESRVNAFAPGSGGESRCCSEVAA